MPQSESMPQAPLVLVERENGWAVVRINRPDKRNAMNRAARRALLATLGDLAQEATRVVVLTGMGESFCAGVDLKESRNDAETGTAPEPASDWIEVCVAIREHPAIFIAAVNGVAMGGGATLINVCDLAVAADCAEIGNPEMGFGAFAQFSGPATQYQIAPKHAAWLVLTTERIDGATAAAWGMVNECVPAARLEGRTRELAVRLAGFDGVALTLSKRALDRLPGAERQWRTAFERGMQVNKNIREQSHVQVDGLKRFASGQRNPGQGRAKVGKQS
jgi:enoyl-CoA hydratase/carnithine racemase